MDINGDGVDDIILGSPFSDGPQGDRKDAGRIDVVLGGASFGEGQQRIDVGRESALTVYGATAGDLAGFYSLPGWLAGTLEREVGGEAPLLADALGLPGPVFLRVNRARASRDEVRDRLASDGVATRPTRLAPDGLEVLSDRPNLLGLPAYREGLLEVQDEGSQLLGAIVGARPGEAVLDACAGAGGKALLLAADVGPAGRTF